MKALFSITILTALLLFNSCRNSDRDRDTSTMSAEEAWIAINNFNYLLREIHRTAAADSILNGVNGPLSLPPNSCIDSNILFPNSGSYPLTSMMYYSDSICDGARSKSGIIQVNYENPYGKLGNIMEVEIQNFEVNDFLISANITMEVVYWVIDTLTFDIKITNGVIVDQSSAGNNVSIHESHLQFSQYKGRKTFTTADDDFVITGTGNGIASNGVIYTFEIMDELILEADCNYETFGSFTLHSDNSLDRVCNVGEGVGCDSKFLVSIPPVNGDHQVNIP